MKYDPELTNGKKVCNAISDMGFEGSLNSPDTVVLQRAELQVARIHVDGMTCQSCVKNIEGTIGAKPDVFSCSVSLDDKQVVIEYNKKLINVQGLCDAIDDMGFESSMLPDHTEENVPRGQEPTCVLNIIGMTCQSCVTNVETNVSPKKGILDIKVSLERKEGVVKYDPDVVTPQQIADMIDDIGFECNIKQNKSRDSHLSSSGGGVPITQITIGIQGMVCNSCVQTIESQMKNTQGTV